MKHELQREIKIIMSLYFISILLLLPQFFAPHAVFLGLFFIRNSEAAFLVSLILVAILFLVYFTSRRYKSVYHAAIALYSMIGINSAVNIISAIFFHDDLQGFIGTVFGDNGFFPAFLVNQGVMLLLSLLVILYLWANKQAFDRK
ncbi:hypothetical protein JXB31_00325 [Candidatus Woesearchaeota archaeon]|nr:hypothetical protein [Candidatus Woesearchaeota archaeon]